MAIHHRSPAKSSKKISHEQFHKDDSGISLGDDKADIWRKTREACLSAIIKVFENVKTPEHATQNELVPSEAAKKYENLLYKKHKNTLNEYKVRFRKDLVALKSSKTNFAESVLSGALTIEEFVDFDDKNLLSKKQRESDSASLEEELKSKMGKKFPTNIRQIKNQNMAVTEQWWISESASKIDPDFDSDYNDAD